MDFKNKFLMIGLLSLVFVQENRPAALVSPWTGHTYTARELNLMRFGIAEAASLGQKIWFVLPHAQEAMQCFPSGSASVVPQSIGLLYAETRGEIVYQHIPRQVLLSRINSLDAARQGPVLNSPVALAVTGVHSTAPNLPNHSQRGAGSSLQSNSLSSSGPSFVRVVLPTGILLGMLIPPKKIESLRKNIKNGANRLYIMMRGQQKPIAMTNKPNLKP